MLTPTTHNAFLAHLIGQWDLTGQMGDTPLRQAVGARWTLGGLFVEMTCRSVLPAAEGEQPYEAVYHIGYNGDHDCYVLHLLDTFGVPISCVAARGRREGDSIPFVFDYDSGPWTYRFTWQRESGAWSCLQTYREDGQVKTFATKQLLPIGSQEPADKI